MTFEQGLSRPGSIELAVRLLFASIVLTVIGVLAEAVSGVEQGAPAVVGALIGVCLQAYLANRIWHCRRWARTVFTVLAWLYLALGGLSVILVLTLDIERISELNALLGLLQMVLTVAVLVQLFKPSASAWLTGRISGSR